VTGIFQKHRSLFATAILWLTTCTLGLYAQSGTAPNVRMEQDLARAEAYLYSFKNDSALFVAQQLLAELKALEWLDSPFGLRVQLTEATALERGQQGDLAIAKLRRVIEQSAKQTLPDVSAKAHLALALLYEEVGLQASSREHLRRAQTYIDRHALDSIYPYFAVRMASWHRIYGDQDSALYYAREALRTAPLFRLELEEAIGHLLMNMLLPRDAVDARLQHSLAAVRLYRKLEDYTGCSYMYGAVASIYFQKGNTRLALAYNDSTLAFAHRAIAEGHKKHATIGGVYRFRSELYRKMGQPDSAFFYLNKGNQVELNLLREDNKAKIIEIDARLSNEKKQSEIDRQRLELVLKKRQLIYTWIIFALVCLLALGLFVSMHKQRQGKRKLTEQNILIQKQSEQLKTLDAAKTRFFANVSHELRTPLTLLLGPIGTLLKENRLTDTQTHLLQMARQSGKQLEQLITDILDLGKLEMGKMELDEKPTDLATFFRSHFAQFESLAESRKLDFSYHIDVPDATVANLDQAKCRQILNNLLANAFKFTPAGGRIEATLALNAGTLQLTVADNGPGIHPDDLPHLFDRYFQTTRPDKPAEGGTGIGLALCHEYAQLFGGKIEVESALGAGTLFRVLFPVERTGRANVAETVPGFQPLAHQELPAPAAVPLEPSDATKPTILVVEDNPDLQAYIRLILSEKYQVVTAANGQEALSMLRDEYSMMHAKQRAAKSSCAIHHAPFPNLILSDLMMPVMDGHQLLEKLKSDDATRHLPVIMLTARAEVQDKLKALRIGVDDYLHKPFDEEELLVRIENLLKNQAARRSTDETEAEVEAATPLLSQPDREWLEKFEGYVQQHYADDLLSVSGLASEFAMSESTLLRQLKRLTGLSPIQYLQEIRLDEARRLLESRRYDSIAQVASKVGYDDARSFSRSFRARFGKLPSEMMGE